MDSGARSIFAAGSGAKPVDRLSRSLLDFAKPIGAFDRRGGDRSRARFAREGDAVEVQLPRGTAEYTPRYRR
jgi:hypothetical protein